MAGSLLADILLAMLPGLAWLAWFLHKDRYEPEPRGLIARAFTYGMLAFAAARLIEPRADGYLAAACGLTALPRWAHLALLVAPLEELLKFAVVRLRFFPDPEFNEPVDGVVYATTVAIGFATLENAVYMQSAGAGVLAFRALSSTLMHLGCSGLIGHALGRQKFSRGRWRVPGAVAGAVALHAGFDLLVTFGPGQAGPLRSALILALVGGFLVRLFSRLDFEIERDLARSPFRPRKRRSGNPHPEPTIMEPPEGGRS